MMFGKLIGGLLGLLAGGLIGLVIGVVVGHFFDTALAGNLRRFAPQAIARIKRVFFETTFQLAGYVAKADGRISEEEIAHTEQLFNQMGLDSERRREAIALFKRGAEPGFAPEVAVGDFLSVVGRNAALAEALLLFLISLAHADGELEAAEHAAMVQIAAHLGVDLRRFNRLLHMARAQQQFHDHGQQAAGGGTDLHDAYAALGVEPGISDRDLKRAYRKLMSENHPDKLSARGVPEEMVRLATTRSQEIQAAYEIVKKSRGLKR